MRMGDIICSLYFSRNLDPVRLEELSSNRADHPEGVRHPPEVGARRLKVLNGSKSAFCNFSTQLCHIAQPPQNVF